MGDKHYYTLNNKARMGTWSRGYRHMALMMSDDGTESKCIRETGRYHIIEDHDGVHVGSSPRSAGYRLWESLREKARDFNVAVAVCGD